MSDALFSRDRLQPALLDRLIDEAPGSASESADHKVISRSRLREIVLRDLGWLLNATGALHDVDERRFSHARRSVLNFGMPCLSGKLASRVELFEMEQTLRRAIVDFEPRIVPDTLVVRGSHPLDDLGHHNVLQFEIGGQLWSQPYPLELLLKTDIDFETGMVQVHEGTLSASLVRTVGAG